MADDLDPYHVLATFVAQYPTQVTAARALGISQPYLNDLLQRQRKFSARVLAKLGLQTIVVKKG